MRLRHAVLGLGVAGVGVAVGTVLEELLYRRVMGRTDPESDEPIGSTPGRSFRVRGPDGTELSCTAYGPPGGEVDIVFAHGFVLDHRLWHYQVRDLVDDGRYRVVVYDARGHGLSGPARGPDGTTAFDEDTLAADLDAVVEQSTSARVVLVGHSMGGMAVQAYLARRRVSPRVAGAVLVNSSYTAVPKKSRVPGFAGLVGIFLADEELLDRVRRPAGDLAMLFARRVFGRGYSPRHVALTVALYERTPSATISAAKALMDLDLSADLGEIGVPVLVVAGDADRVTPCEDSRVIAERVEGAELVVLEGCGHMAPFERYGDLGVHLAKFCERVIG